jgi:hypothetical protein
MDENKLWSSWKVIPMNARRRQGSFAASRRSFSGRPCQAFRAMFVRELNSFFNYFALKEARDIHIGKPPPAHVARRTSLEPSYSKP